MGDGTCSWFGRPPTTARVIDTAQEGGKNVTGWECALTDIWGVYWWRWGGEGKNKGAEVDTKYIQQSTMAGSGNGRQQGAGVDGG